MSLFNETIVALSTSQGNGAIAVIRVSGTKAKAVTEKFFKPKNKREMQHSVIQLGTFHSPDKKLIDEALVCFFKNPNSYTGEDIIEISCHNSTFIIDQIIKTYLSENIRLATAGEFTQRAFLNGKMDLAQAEAVGDLIASENKASHQIALSQMRGGISSQLDILREQLIHFTALLELELDFSEEDVEFANRNELLQLIKNIQETLKNLIQTFKYGNAIKKGIPVAIIGKPNAGKSTLLNALLNEERAIVSSIEGTTRDTIEEVMQMEGIAFRFIDTAGLRETSNEIENLGIEKTKQKIHEAQIIIHLYEDDSSLLDSFDYLLKDKIVFNLLSKADLHSVDIQKNTTLTTFYHYKISVKENQNIDKLKHDLVQSIKGNISDNQIIITNARHYNELTKALDELFLAENGYHQQLSSELIAFHLRNALKHLSNITGAIDIDKDILGTIFGKFCIGK